MNQQLFTNNFGTTLSASVSQGASSITIPAAQAALLPTLTNGDFIVFTLTQAGPVDAETSWEQVTVTAVNTSTGVLTCSPLVNNWPSGAKCEIRLTSTYLNRISPRLNTGLVATRCRVPSYFLTTIFASMSRSAHVAMENLTSVQLMFANWYVAGAGNTTIDYAEKGTGAAMSLTVTIEYPAGVFTVVRQSGNGTWSIPDGTTATSDPCSVNIPRGAMFWVRAFQQNPNGVISTVNVANALVIDGYQASGATDQTQGGTVLANGAATIYRPVAIIGQTTQETAVIIGDSIAQGQADTMDGQLDVGMFSRRVAGKMAYTNLAIGGDRLYTFLTNNSKRMAIITAVNPSRIYCNYGYNDIVAGARTYAQVIADMASVAALFSGKRFYQSEITPTAVTTSDFFATTGGQTVSSATNASTRRAVNGALRKSQIPGITGVISTLSYETADGSNIWKAEANGRTVTDFSSTSGSPLISSNTANFTVEDDWKFARILGAGNSGGNLTVIMRYVSSTQISMLTPGGNTQNAGTTVTNGTMNIQACLSTQDGTHPSGQANREFTRSGAMEFALP